MGTGRHRGAESHGQGGGSRPGRANVQGLQGLTEKWTKGGKESIQTMLLWPEKVGETRINIRSTSFYKKIPRKDKSKANKTVT